VSIVRCCNFAEANNNEKYVRTYGARMSNEAFILTRVAQKNLFSRVVARRSHTS